MDGLLLIDKPIGWTSFDVVARARNLLRTARQHSAATIIPEGQSSSPSKVKVGHTGTLDPMASGLLVLVVGSYTKRAAEFTKLDKSYDVTMKLGETSPTGDSEADAVFVSAIRPAENVVREAMQHFVGEIEQVPPAFSAIKVGGQRAYKLARAGKQVNIDPRMVTIRAIRGFEYNYPFVRFTAEVSSGTYIRSLVEDIGKHLQTGAYMTALRRTTVGKFSLENAVPVEDLNWESIQQHLSLED